MRKMPAPMSSHPDLFPALGDLTAAENRLTQALDRARARQPDRAVAPSVPSADWRAELAQFSFDTSQALSDVTDWTMAALEDGIVQMTHPGYLGLFNPSPAFPSECADRIAGVYNPQMGVWSHAPNAVEIELHVLAQVARRAGYGDDAGGHFTSGGSEANTAAVLCALTAINPQFSEEGARCFSGQPTLYASRESHLAWLKIAHATGIGRDAVRLVGTDGAGRMSAEALKGMIDADLEAGCVPVTVLATAGTTNAGMVDPLLECRRIADDYGLWLHIDAAWGGALIASDARRDALAGIETADSITIDAHKWFATTMGAGMFLTRHPDIPADVFRVSASYMPESEAANDFYLNSAQWSRRFVGLRLFMSLAVAGWRGYGDHVEHAIGLIERLASGLEAAGWRTENASPMAVGCFSPPGGQDAVQAAVDAVQASGRFWVSKAIFEDRPVLRACVTNGRTTIAEIDALVEFLRGL